MTHLFMLALILTCQFATDTTYAGADEVRAVRSLLKQFAAAAREGDGKRLIELSDAGTREPDRSLIMLMAGVSHLRSESEKRFGRPPGNTTGGIPTDAQIDAAEIRIERDVATATFADIPAPTVLRRIDRRWVFSMRDVTRTAGGIEAAVLRRLGARASDLARQVSAGEFETLEEVEAAFARAITEETQSPAPGGNESGTEE